MQSLVQSAEDILKKNDLGSYTVPTHGLYPFQWNWDSCLTALVRHILTRPARGGKLQH